MVDHTYVYSGAVEALRRLVQEQALDELWFYESSRLSAPIRSDVNVVAARSLPRYELKARRFRLHRS